MSFQAMSWAVKQKVGNATGKAILLMLANYADEAGACFPGQGKLANECECSERTVREWLAKFEELGLVRRDARRRSDGYRTSDAIVLSMRISPANAAAEILPAGNSPENASPENPSDLTGRSCRAINSQVNHQNSSKRERAKEPSQFEELRRVLDDDHARAVIEHRKNFKAKFSPYAAKLLAKKFEACPDPNAAADEMIANGWQGFKASWLRSEPLSGGRSDQRSPYSQRSDRNDDARSGVRSALAGRNIRAADGPSEQGDRPERPDDEYRRQLPGRSVSLSRGEDGVYADRDQHLFRHANARH